MNAGLVMRSPKFRILLYILVLGVACLMMILIHNFHVHLKEVENYYNICQKEKEKCDRGKDSFSAQLQVIYERKQELEASLKQERSEHQKTKEDREKKNLETQAIQSQLEKELNELQLKHSQLLSDYKLLKDKNSQMENKLAELKQDYSLIEEEKKNLNFEVSSHLQTLRQKTEEINKLHEHLKKVSFEKEQLYHDNSQLSWKLNQYDSKLMICKKQHHQLMLQFDEISLQLNNCVNPKNLTMQEKLILKQKSDFENSPLPNSVVQFDHNESYPNEKFVHIPDMKVSHPPELIENINKNTEEAIIGNEFNDTLNMNMSVPFVTNINGGNQQIDVSLKETILKEKLNISLKNTSVGMSESTLSKWISAQQENTTLINQVEKTVNQLPLPVPQIVNNSKIKINISTNTTNLSNSNINNNDADLHQENKTIKFDDSNLHMSNLLNKNVIHNQTITSETHLEHLKNKINFDNSVMNGVQNIKHTSFEEIEQPDYIRPGIQNRDTQFQKDIPFENEINASKMDGDYNQEQPLDNMRADYDNERIINNIPET